MHARHGTLGSVERGQLRVYLGAAPGVGKTHAALDEARRRQSRGATTAVLAVGDAPGGAATPRGAESSGALLDGLARIPLRSDGSPDVAAAIALAPAVIVLDDLAARSPDGSARHALVAGLLDAGCDVIGTANVTEIASLSDVVTAITGHRPHATVPDALLRDGAQVELVDMAPEALRRRLAHGHVHTAEHDIGERAALFRPEVLGALRRLTLQWLAERVEETLDAGRGAGDLRERVVVALSGQDAGDVIRRAARLAGRSGGQLIGVHVAGDDAEPGPLLEQQREVLVALGGTYREVVAEPVTGALAEFARASGATQVVVGDDHLHAPARAELARRLAAGRPSPDLHVVLGQRQPNAPGPTTRPRHGRFAVTHRYGAYAWLLAVAGPPLLTFLLTLARRHVAVGTALLADLCVVLAASALGGIGPGLAASGFGFVLTNWYLTPPLHTLDIAASQNVVALSVFVLITGVVSLLVSRATRRAGEARRATAQAHALARSSATLVGAADPLPDLLEQLRATFDLPAASVLEREGAGWWPVHTSGEPAPMSPDEGTAFDLGHDGERYLVVTRGALEAEQVRVLRGFADQLALALRSRDLRAEAAEADRLAEADAFRSAMLQAVSHDFRTPLATIRAAASGLLQPGVAFDPTDRDQLLSDIDGAAAKLDRMVANLLDMTRLQAGGLHLHRAPTALEEVVAAAVQSVDAAAGRVRVAVSDDLPLVDADGALLERAVANLLSNAVAWSPAEHQVVVDAYLAGAVVELRIRDRGPGIPAARRAQLFEPFQRAGDRSHDAGVGLGLAIARGFVEAMGGRLTANDTPGGGLTMSIGLPVHAGEDATR